MAGREIFRKFFSVSIVLVLTTITPLSSITVDLREPTFSEGVLKTDKGGVIQGPKLRVQAKKIIYTHKVKDEVSITQVDAEEDLIVEFGDFIFVGKRLVYDFEAGCGTIVDGRVAAEPWFFGGKNIYLCPDGSYHIKNGYATTSENYQADWKIETEEAVIKNHCLLAAKNVTFRFFHVPLFWLPSFRTNLNSIFDSPFRYTVRLGGTQGPRVGLKYDIFTWRGLKTRLQLDYRIMQGVGGGLEFDYRSPCHTERFQAINYIGEDKTLFDRKTRTRYRYYGVYDNIFKNGKTTIHGSYDKLSDKEMASDYDDRGLKLDAAKRTQLEIRHQESAWIANLLARFRVNDFQTLKQELPTLSASTRPFVMGDTGIVSDNHLKLSYLELEFSDDRPEGKDFNSPRYEFHHTFYRPIKLPCFTVTPQAGILAIYYGNNSEQFDRWMTLGLFEVDINTSLYRFYGSCKHVISPYLSYYYYTFPTTSPDDHFIFDIDDGWYRLNMLKWGIATDIYSKTYEGCLYRNLHADLYINGFFDTKTLSQVIPKIYCRLVYNMSQSLRHTVNSAWDLKRNLVDHWNYLIEWTLNSDAAVAAEYRHRSAYDWRKVDHANFILDSFRDSDELKDSTLSDLRDTFLLHFFYRFNKNWALDVVSRTGWRRKDEPSYNEFQTSFIGTLRSSWHFRFAYRHREDDDRFIFNFSIGLKPPNSGYSSGCVPCLEF